MANLVGRLRARLGRVWRPAPAAPRADRAKAVPPFPGTAVGGWEAYERHRVAHAEEYSRRRAIEHDLIPTGVDAFDVDGFCAVCAQPRQFHVTFLYAYDKTDDGRVVPNWREHLVCRCGFGNRVRAALHYFFEQVAPRKDSAIFITEQTTPLYAWLKSAFPGTAGSEYLGPNLAGGSCDARGYRHEDLMRLSFASGTFDAVLSFDVLEHVADSTKSFQECLRCLKPGGLLLFTAPFTVNLPTNTVRAVERSDGSIEHILPPEYHGNPIDPQGGSLCFRYFGWQMLDDLRACGFQNPRAILYWSRELGYLGGEQVLFVASKPR